MKRFLIFATALILVSACATVPAVSTSQSENELRTLESAKWQPSSFGSAEEFMALFAEDFVSVEYGANPAGGVTRKTRADAFAGGPLPPAKFELSDWRFVHPDAATVVISYRVNALTFPWHAYATSVWTRRSGKWKTVFYQASTSG